jgi:hypothetical protein
MRWSPIVELRQYTLLPGQRDVLIDLFEAELVESQEECGMKVIGTFRDLDDPTKFVWLRGFQSLEDRPGGLGCFYDGSVWKRHRELANRTMVDSDDVLLLRAAHPGGGFALAAEGPPLHAEGGLDRGIVEATIVHLDDPADGEVLAHFDQEIAPRVTQAGGSLSRVSSPASARTTSRSCPCEKASISRCGFRPSRTAPPTTPRGQRSPRPSTQA